MLVKRFRVGGTRIKVFGFHFLVASRLRLLLDRLEVLSILIERCVLDLFTCLVKESKRQLFIVCHRGIVVFVD